MCNKRNKLQSSTSLLTLISKFPLFVVKNKWSAFRIKLKKMSSKEINTLKVYIKFALKEKLHHTLKEMNTNIY